MDGTTAAGHCAALVKEADPARFVGALFAPEATRRRLLALYALDAELRRVPLAAREPMIVAIRYQWWRDAVTGLPEATRGHPVLGELLGHHPGEVHQRGLRGPVRGLPESGVVGSHRGDVDDAAATSSGHHRVHALRHAQRAVEVDR